MLRLVNGKLECTSMASPRPGIGSSIRGDLIIEYPVGGFGCLLPSIVSWRQIQLGEESAKIFRNS